MLISIKPKFVFVAILVLEIALHWNIWQRDIMGIHAWRQVQTMSVVENFAFEDMNILNPRINFRGDGDGIFRMEFPLMQWGFAWFYKFFGAKLSIARILTFLISILSVIGFYRLLRCYDLSKTISALGAWCFAWSPVLFYYSVNPLPDNLALCFGIWSLAFLKQHQNNNSKLSLTAFAVFLALAAAVKLPFILFGAGYIPIFIKNFKLLRTGQFITQFLITFLSLIPAAAWYFWVIPQWKNTALIGGVGAEKAFDYQLAANNVWGVFHSQLPELFINYGSVLFFLFGLAVFIQTTNALRKYRSEILIVLSITSFYLYEVNMIGLEHDYYLFPYLPMLFLVVSSGINSVFSQKKIWLQTIGLIALLILPLTAYLRTADRWTPMGYECAILANKQALEQLTPANELVVAGNDPSMQIFLYHIRKKGWAFQHDWLTPEELKMNIAHGARYLYSNTDLFETNDGFSQLLGEPVFNQDGITVYPLHEVNGF